MSTIPKSRDELINIIQINFDKLISDLDDYGPKVSKLKTENNWTVKELLGIRAWWTSAVVKWVRDGKKGKHPVTPAKGYSWKETPRLNDDIANERKKDSYEAIRKKLKREHTVLLKTTDSLSEHELMNQGVFEWAGDKWPVSRWLSVNTARQYTTARKFVRKAIKEANE